MRHPMLDPYFRERAIRLALLYKKRPDYNDLYGKHRQLISFPTVNKVPDVDLARFVAPSATIVGEVTLGPKVSVWNDVVIRGELKGVKIGPLTNIQDKVVISDDWRPKNQHHDGSTLISSSVSIGPGSILKACTVNAFCLIGARSVLSSGCFLNKGVILLPGTVVPENFVIPPKQIWGGNPAKFVREFTFDDEAYMMKKVDNTIELAHAHALEYFLLSQTAYLERERMGIKSNWVQPYGSALDYNASLQDVLDLHKQLQEELEQELDEEVEAAYKELALTKS